MAEQEPKDNLALLRELKKDYLRTFHTESGKKVLEDLQAKCFFKSTTYPKSNEGLRLAFNEGQRSIALHIVNMMNLDIEKIRQRLEQEGEQ